MDCNAPCDPVHGHGRVQATNLWNLTSSCPPLTNFEGAFRTVAAGLRERSCNPSSIVCSWRIGFADHLEQASIGSCAFCNDLCCQISNDNTQQ